MPQPPPWSISGCRGLPASCSLFGRRRAAATRCCWRYLQPATGRCGRTPPASPPTPPSWQALLATETERQQQEQAASAHLAAPARPPPLPPGWRCCCCRSARHQGTAPLAAAPRTRPAAASACLAVAAASLRPGWPPVAAPPRSPPPAAAQSTCSRIGRLAAAGDGDELRSLSPAIPSTSEAVSPSNPASTLLSPQRAGQGLPASQQRREVVTQAGGTEAVPARQQRHAVTERAEADLALQQAGRAT